MTLIQTNWAAVNESDGQGDYTCEDLSVESDGQGDYTCQDLSVETDWAAVNESNGPDDCTCEFVSVSSIYRRRSGPMLLVFSSHCLSC